MRRRRRETTGGFARWKPDRASDPEGMAHSLAEMATPIDVGGTKLYSVVTLFSHLGQGLYTGHRDELNIFCWDHWS